MNFIIIVFRCVGNNGAWKSASQEIDSKAKTQFCHVGDRPFKSHEGIGCHVAIFLEGGYSCRLEKNVSLIIE